MELINHFKEIFLKIPQSFYLPILLLVSSTIFFSIGLIHLFTSRPEQTVSPISSENTEATTSARQTFGLLKVDVEGAVMSPGVYSLPTNSRVQDAVLAAGGLSLSVDREIIAQRINLATKITDGMKIYIPPTVQSAQQSNGENDSSPTDYLGQQVHLVDINQATASELDSLPGVGPATVQKIISTRPYISVDDLQTKKVVSASLYEKIKNLITVY